MPVWVWFNSLYQIVCVIMESVSKATCSIKLLSFPPAFTKIERAVTTNGFILCSVSFHTSQTLISNQTYTPQHSIHTTKTISPEKNTKYSNSSTDGSISTSTITQTTEISTPVIATIETTTTKTSTKKLRVEFSTIIPIKFTSTTLDTNASKKTDTTEATTTKKYATQIISSGVKITQKPTVRSSTISPITSISTTTDTKTTKEASTTEDSSTKKYASQIIPYKVNITSTTQIPTVWSSTISSTTFTSNTVDTDGTKNISLTVIAATKKKATQTIQSKVILTSTAQKLTVESSTITPSTVQKSGNEVSTCNRGVCKRIASLMLSMINHENKKYCEDCFNTICFKSENIKQNFLEGSFKNLFSIINNHTNDDVKVFRDFYDMCNNYTHSISRINKYNNLQRFQGTDRSDTVAESILIQSMPFFDVGLNIRNDTFIFEMTLPGLSYLKTNIEGWSLREKKKEDCIRQVTDNIYQNVVELDETSNYVDECIREVIYQYITEFSKEMDDLSTLTGIKVTKYNDDVKVYFPEIFDVIQKSLAPYRYNSYPASSPLELTLSKLNSRYELGIDWIEVFKKLAEPHNVNENTTILFSNDLDVVFTHLVDKKDNITSMLNLWNRVQYYNNFIVEAQIGNRGDYCMKLSSQLLPEISYFLITDLIEDKNQEVYILLQSLMEKLKDQFQKSLISANFGENSISEMEKRVRNVELVDPKSSNMKSGNIYPMKTSYEDQLLELIKKYKKTIYSQAGNTVTSDKLLKLFVNVFDTSPRTFPPYREIVFQPGFVHEVSEDFPDYILLAKKGLPLAQSLSKHFVRNDFDNKLNSSEVAIYESLIKSPENHLERSSYTVQGTKCEIEDLSGGVLNYDSLVGDNMAFRLVSDIFSKISKIELLPFVDKININDTFITTSLQDFCKPNKFADFIADYYNMDLPAPVKMKNIASNSELFANTFGCSSRDRMQFPFVNKILN